MDNNEIVINMNFEWSRTVKGLIVVKILTESSISMPSFSSSLLLLMIVAIFFFFMVEDIVVVTVAAFEKTVVMEEVTQSW